MHLSHTHQLLICRRCPHANMLVHVNRNTPLGLARARPSLAPPRWVWLCPRGWGDALRPCRSQNGADVSTLGSHLSLTAHSWHSGVSLVWLATKDKQKKKKSIVWVQDTSRVVFLMLCCAKAHLILFYIFQVMKNRKKVAVFPLPPELRENLNIPIKKKKHLCFGNLFKYG